MTPGRLPPLKIHPRRRFLRISWFFLRVIVHVFFFDILLNRWWGTRWYARRTGIERWVLIARRFRGLAVRMGGVLIKLGQFLSSRADILPMQITDELAGLQDEMPPAPLPYILSTRIDEIVEVDLRAVEWAVRIIRNYPPIKRRADLLALFEEFKRVLIQELDYVQEAQNAEIIRGHLADV